MFNSIDYKTEYLNLKAKTEANEALFLKKYKMPLATALIYDNIKFEIIPSKESSSYQLEHEPERFEQTVEPIFESTVESKSIKYIIPKQNFGYGFNLHIEYRHRNVVKILGMKWNEETKLWDCPLIKETIYKLIKCNECRFVSKILKEKSWYEYEPLKKHEVNEIYEEHVKNTSSANIKQKTIIESVIEYKDAFEINSKNEET